MVHGNTYIQLAAEGVTPAIGEVLGHDMLLKLTQVKDDYTQAII